VGLPQALISDYASGPLPFRCVTEIVDGPTTLRDFCVLSTGSQTPTIRDLLRASDGRGTGFSIVACSGRRSGFEFTTASTSQFGLQNLWDIAE
jgi:hypothetical protein